MMDSDRLQLKFDRPESLRLDRFLAEELNNLSRSHIQKVISQGHVAVNGRTAKPSRLLSEGDVIDVCLPPPRKLSAEPEPIPLSVIYEDEHLIAVDKAAGMVVHPASGHTGGTLVNALLAHCHNLSGIGGVLRPGIVHRLDIGTSGVMVVAKSDAAHQGLAAQFKERKVEKFYKAIVYGKPQPAEGTIDLPIGRDRRNRKKISPATDRPRDAVTRYTVVEDFGETSFLHLQLFTGRTHQVRVHMSHLGHPLVGDFLYGGTRWRSVKNPEVRLLAKSFGRPALHAFSLRLVHPFSGELITFQAPLPVEFTDLLGALRDFR